MTDVLLVVYRGVDLDEVRAAVGDEDVHFVVATGLEELRTAFAAGTFDHVVMGGGLDIETRLAAVREVFRLSAGTTVHLKDRASGPGGYAAFVAAVVTGMAGYSASPG
ncbi:hypothetical protein ACQP2F_23810 [Actinoplanes sp. CA-030573]|uniref:hypothetical protein n=1 Tax=Actinoplanes sp. CA-030573 TaxID=3239898 RepID=UPI003D8C4DC7